MPRRIQDVLEELMIDQDRREAYNDWSASRQMVDTGRFVTRRGYDTISNSLRGELTQIAKIIMKYDATDEQMNIAKRLYPDAIIIKEDIIDLD